MTKHPAQRAVPAKVHTTAGWITGVFHPPKQLGFLDFLQNGSTYFNLTDVRLPGGVAPLPYFGLRRTTVHLVEPTCQEWELGLGRPSAGAQERLVSCLLDAGALAGRMEILEGMRVSDYLARHEGFVILRHAVLGPSHVPAALLLVNTACLTGIADLGPARGALRRAPEPVAEVTEELDAAAGK